MCQWLYITTYVICCVGIARGYPAVVTSPGGNFTVKHSASQLGSAVTETFIVVPGSSLDTATTIIPNRYTCVDHTITFAINDTDPLMLMATITTAWKMADKVTCTIDWADGQTDDVKFDKSTMESDHTYAVSGFYEVVAACTDEKDNSETCPVQDTSCVNSTDLLDDFFNNVGTPMTIIATDAIVLMSYVELAPSCISAPPTYNWRFNRIDNSTLTAFTDFHQPANAVIRLPAESLETGLYSVHLEITFSNGPAFWVHDVILIHVILPELVVNIYGGAIRTFPYGQLMTINATLSRDTVKTLASVTAYTIIDEWQFVYYGSLPSTMDQYIKGFPQSAAPGGGTNYEIQPGSEYLLDVDTSQFSPGGWCIVMFSLSRGDRMSSTIQVVEVVTDAVPVTISCVYNCNLGRERKFNHDQIQYDAILPADVTDLEVTYSWQLYGWNTFYNVWSALAIDSPTGVDTQSIQLTNANFSPGQTYKITLVVTVVGYAASSVSTVGTVNYIPYNGICTIAPVTGTAATDWFTVSCANWLGADDRTVRSAPVDNNPILSFLVLQTTPGAELETEPILYTRSLKSHVIVKLGDPLNYYATTISVQIMDMYKNYAEISLPLQATPAFDWQSVDASEAGANIVRTYSRTDYAAADAQLRALGKVDMVVTLVTSVCSHLHHIELPVWEPPVPRTLNNEQSAILDLNADGDNTEVGSLGEVLVATYNETTDPATLAIQELVQNLTSVLVDMVEEHVANNGSRHDDKQLLSMITNCFTNLAARDNFANTNVLADLIYLGQLIGKLYLVPADTVADDAAEIDTAVEDLNSMTIEIVNTVVPNNLRQLRTVQGLHGGRAQIAGSIEVTGQNMSIDDAEISPEERAFLFLRMQKLLAYQLDEQRSTAERAAQMALHLTTDIMDNVRLCTRCDNRGNNKTKQLLSNKDALTFASTNTSMENSAFRLDGLLGALDRNSENTTTSVSAIEFEENVFMYDTDKQSSLVSSKILHIDVKANNVKVSPGNVTYEQAVVTPEPFVVTPLIDPEDASQFSLHKFIYQSANDYLCIIVKPDDPELAPQYSAYISMKGIPTVIDYDILFTIRKEDNYKYCLTPAEMKGHTGLTYVGIRITDAAQKVKYSFTQITVTCMVWDEDDRRWYSDKCKLTWYPDDGKISCQCQNVSHLTFGNSFQAAPNYIDFSSVFLKFSPLNQAAVMGCLSGVFTVYILVVICVRGKDRNDKYKWGVTPLYDNFSTDTHYYLIRVYTGMRRSSGTKSNVGFVLTGAKGDTGARTLSDGIRKGFATGSTMTFLMATQRHLGNLLHMSVWHDDSGLGGHAGWYLNQVVVYDVLTKDTVTFVSERWLSAGTSVECNMVAKYGHEKSEFENRFFNQTRSRLSETHMWASIMYRPQASTFTRVQRTSCVLVYILLTMIANAMYFNPDDDYQAPALIRVGPFRFTLQQIYVSVICAAITTPVVMVIVFLFKHIKRKPTTSYDVCCCCCCKRGSPNSDDVYAMELDRKILDTDTSQQSGCLLHHRCIYGAWLLVVAGTVVPAFFILLYSMEWGQQKSEEWLSTFLLSLVESIVLVDPLLVVFLSFVCACVARRADEESALNVDNIVENYKRLTPTAQAPRIPPRRPTDKVLETSALFRKHQANLLSMCKDILMNVFLMWIVFSVAFSNRDNRSYLHYRDMVNRVVTPWKLPHFHKIKTPGDMFTWISGSVFPALFPESDYNGDHLHWRTKQFATGTTAYRLGPPRLRQLRTFNEFEVTSVDCIVNEDVGRHLLSVDTYSCEVPMYGSVPCYGEYSIVRESKGDYCIGWETWPCSVLTSTFNYSAGAWQYTSALDNWGLPIVGVYKTYGGGGYLATFDVNYNVSVSILDELFDNLWLDRHTRAVFLEFTLYCANTNIFIYNNYLVEFPETGGAFTSYYLYPIRVYQHTGPAGLYTLICEFFFLIYLIVLLCKISIRLYQQGRCYFKRIWQVYEFIMLVIGVTCIVAYFIRLALTSVTINKFKSDTKVFVNFYHIVLWDQILGVLLAVLVFMATIRILQVFSTSKKISAIVFIISNCARDMFWFGMTFFYIFFGFCFLGFLLFGSQLLSYKNMFKTMGKLFVSMIGKSKFAEINQIDPVLAKIFFFLYILSVVFFILTLFLSILNESIDDVTKNTRQDDSKDDLLSFLFTSMKYLIWKPTSKHERKLTSNKVNPNVSAMTTTMVPTTSGEPSTVAPNTSTSSESSTVSTTPSTTSTGAPTTSSSKSPNKRKSSVATSVTSSSKKPWRL